MIVTNAKIDGERELFTAFVLDNYDNEVYDKVVMTPELEYNR